MTAHAAPFWVNDAPSARFTQEEKDNMLARLDKLDQALVAYLQKLKDSQKQIEEELKVLQSQMDYINENFLKNKKKT